MLLALCAAVVAWLLWLGVGHEEPPSPGTSPRTQPSAAGGGRSRAAADANEPQPGAAPALVDAGVPARILRGVVESASGAPIVGAAVECRAAGAFTDAEGRFELAAPAGVGPGEVVELRASALGHVAATVALDPHSDAAIVITLSARVRILGRVVDAEGPVGGVSVYALTAGGRVSVVTDAAGEFIVDKVSGATVDLQVEAPGRLPVRRRVPAGRNDREVLIVVGPDQGATDLRVEDADGRPVAGAQVSVVYRYGAEVTLSGTTRRDGFCFTVPRGISPSQVTVRAPGVPSQQFAGSDPPRDGSPWVLRLLPTATVTVAITGAGDLVWRVSAIACAAVRAPGTTPAEQGRARTLLQSDWSRRGDLEAAIRRGAPPFRPEMWAEADESGTAVIGGLLAGARYVIVGEVRGAASGPGSPIQFIGIVESLPAGGASLRWTPPALHRLDVRIRVRNGQPADRAVRRLVSIEFPDLGAAEHPAPRIETETTAAETRWFVPAGSVRVAVRSGGETSTESVDVRGDTAVEIPVPAGHEVTGVLRASDGAPLEGCNVMLWRHGSSGGGCETRTDARGRFRFDGVAVGEWRLAHDGASGEPLAGGPVNINVPCVPVEISVRSDGRVDGVVKGVQGPVLVGLSYDNAGSPFLSQSVSDGVPFSFTGLHPGRWTVSVRRFGGEGLYNAPLVVHQATEFVVDLDRK